MGFEFFFLVGYHLLSLFQCMVCCYLEELISIIVPVYQANRFIRETMDCVLAQTYPDWELLLIEDGSTDGTPETIRSYCEKKGENRIRLICQPVNGGAARARNRGLEEAKGRYIAYQDADH